MATRTRITRKHVEPEEEDVEEEEVEEEAEEEEVEADYDEEDVEEEEVEEEEEPEPAPRKVIKTVKPTLPGKKVVVPPHPVGKKILPPAPVAKKVAKPQLEETNEVPQVKKVSTAVVENFLVPMLDSLETDGKALIVTRLSDDKWQFKLADVAAPAAGKKVRGKEYNATVLSPEYIKWQKEWQALTYEEKVAQAKKMGVEWKRDKDPRMDAMRLTEAVCENMGISKYRPEYDTREARAALLR